MARGKKYEDKLYIDMSFGEALSRFVGVAPAEVEDNIRRSKTKKPTGKPPTRGGKGNDKPAGTRTDTNALQQKKVTREGKNAPSAVVSLRDIRTRRHNGN